MSLREKIFLIEEGSFDQKKTVIIASKKLFPTSVQRHRVKRQIRAGLRVTGKEQNFQQRKIIVLPAIKSTSFATLLEHLKSRL